MLCIAINECLLLSFFLIRCANCVAFVRFVRCEKHVRSLRCVAHGAFSKLCSTLSVVPVLMRTVRCLRYVLSNALRVLRFAHSVGGVSFL